MNYQRESSFIVNRFQKQQYTDGYFAPIFTYECFNIGYFSSGKTRLILHVNMKTSTFYETESYTARYPFYFQSEMEKAFSIKDSRKVKFMKLKVKEYE